MKVICSYREAEGKPAPVREKEPLDDLGETHGVCAEHKAMLKSLEIRPRVTREDEHSASA